MRYHFEPCRHDGGWIDCIAGEKQRHGQDLADAHEALAGLHNAGNDQRERREQRGGKHHDDKDIEQRARAPIEPDSKEQ